MKKIQLVLISDLYGIIDTCIHLRTAVRFSQGHSVIDGKSILGIFSLNWSKPVEIEVENGDYTPFEKFIVEE